jgi:hypothetical protein
MRNHRQSLIVLAICLIGFASLAVLIGPRVQASIPEPRSPVAYREYNLAMKTNHLSNLDTTFLKAPTRALTATNVHLYGYITDLGGAPIAWAYVDLQDENYASLTNTLTNDLGYYEFLVPSHTLYRLGVSVWYDNNGYSLQKYIPTTKDINLGTASTVRTDVTLRPGGNLIINAYDANGNVIRRGAFTAIAKGQAYATNLMDLPEYGIYFAAQDDYCKSHGCNWDLTLPAFVVMTDTNTRIHVLWEVPDFGQVVLDIKVDPFVKTIDPLVLR